MHLSLRDQRARTAGQGLIDYLVLTCAVAAIMFPVLQSAVFGPLEEAIFSQREGLVNFIGQSRKQPVPNEWFGAKEAKQAANTKFQDQQLDPAQNIDNPQQISDPQALQAGNLNAPQNLKNPSKLDTGKIGRPDSIAPAGELSAGRISEPGQLNAGAGGGGGSGFGSGNSSLGNDFFAGDAGKGGGKGGDVISESSRSESKSSRRSGGSFDIEEATGEVSGGDTAVAKQKKEKGDSAKSDQTVAGGIEKKKRGMAAEDSAREDVDRRSSKVDWSKVIRIIIILLILFLVMLIILSNAKRVGGGR